MMDGERDCPSRQANCLPAGKSRSTSIVGDAKLSVLVIRVVPFTRNVQASAITPSAVSDIHCRYSTSESFEGHG